MGWGVVQTDRQIKQYGDVKVTSSSHAWDRVGGGVYAKHLIAILKVAGLGGSSGGGVVS